MVVEFQLQSGGKLHLISVAFLVDFLDGHGREVGLDISGHGRGHQVCGHAEHVGVDFVPLVVGVEVDGDAVGKHDVIFVGEPFQVFLGIGDGLAGEVGLDKGGDLLRQLGRGRGEREQPERGQ